MTTSGIIRRGRVVTTCRHYADGTSLTSTPDGFVSARVLCSDGRLRVVDRIALSADTYFSIPASVTVKRKKVSGYVTVETRDGFTTETPADPAVVKFARYDYGKNADLLPPGLWDPFKRGVDIEADPPSPERTALMLTRIRSDFPGRCARCGQAYRCDHTSNPDVSVRVRRALDRAVALGWLPDWQAWTNLADQWRADVDPSKRADRAPSGVANSALAASLLAYRAWG